MLLRVENENLLTIQILRSSFYHCGIMCSFFLITTICNPDRPKIQIKSYLSDFACHDSNSLITYPVCTQMTDTLWKPFYHARPVQNAFSITNSCSHVTTIRHRVTSKYFDIACSASTIHVVCKSFYK